METLEQLTEAIADMENKCEYIRTSISHMQRIEGMSSDAILALCDSFQYICYAVHKAQDAFVAQVRHENVDNKEEHSKLPW